MSIFPILMSCFATSPIVKRIEDITFSTKPMNVIEIGAKYGESTLLTLELLNVQNYYIIDPYESYLNKMTSLTL